MARAKRGDKAPLLPRLEITPPSDTYGACDWYCADAGPFTQECWLTVPEPRQLKRGISTSKSESDLTSVPCTLGPQLDLRRRCKSLNDLTDLTPVPLLSPRVVPPFSWSQDKLLFSLAAMGVLVGSMDGIMLPFFPFEATQRGASQTLVSAVFSVFSLTKLVVSPMVGRLVPYVGVTRLHCIGMVISGLATIVFGLLCYVRDDQLFIVLCFIVRIIEGVGTATMMASAFTIIGNELWERAENAVALVASAIALGISLSPALGGGLYSLSGFGAPFYTMGVVLLLAAAGTHWLVPPLPGRRETSRLPLLSMLRDFSKSKTNWLCVLLVFVYWFSWLAVSTCITAYATSVLEIELTTFGLYFSVPCLIYLITNWLWAKLFCHCRNPYLTMSLCIFLVSIAHLLLAPSPLLIGFKPSWWLLGVGMTLMNAFYGGGYTPCFQLMLKASVRRGLADDVSAHSFICTVYCSAVCAGSVLGPLLCGVLVDVYGFPMMVTCLAALNMLTAVLAMIQAFRSRCVEVLSVEKLDESGQWHTVSLQQEFRKLVHSHEC